LGQIVPGLFGASDVPLGPAQGVEARTQGRATVSDGSPQASPVLDVENGSPPRLQKIFYTMSRENREYPCDPECSIAVDN
jgi:hypothetical protein